MKRHLLLLLFTAFIHTALLAQMPYTQKAFAVGIENDIPYGTATSFAGNQVELLLDIYKPIGDDNCRRPLLVMVHGGGFIAGDRHDFDVVQICQEMAARGYVTASIEYRLGLHPLAFYQPYALCNDAINPVGISKCIYMADTLEFYRGMYRATQDLRGAIRFLKGRHDLDSTDVHNVFVGGSSAGAITALHTALIDQQSKVPPFTGAIADAPVPDGDLTSCVPAPGLRSRPDLGDFEGAMNLNGHVSGVQGVAGFMGAIFDTGILDEHSPPLYLYHRSDDLVVPSNSAQLFGLYPFCLNPINLCQPLNTRPWVHGSDAIQVKIVALGSSAPALFNDILTSYGPADGDDCLDNPPGHSIDNIPLRCEHLSGFFAPIIAGNGNSPSGNCVSATHFARHETKLRVYPNPVRGGQIRVSCDDCPDGEATFRLFDGMGRTVAQAKGNPVEFQWKFNDMAAGVYFLQIVSPGYNEVRRVNILMD